MPTQNKTKQIATASVDGTLKRGRPRTIRKDDFEEGLSIMGTKRGRRWPEIVENEGMVLEAKVQKWNVVLWRRRGSRRRRGKRRRRGRTRSRKEED
jgi:hypothetical protein